MSHPIPLPQPRIFSGERVWPLTLLLLCGSPAVLAETPRQIAQTYIAEANAQQGTFTPSAARGAAFFTRRFTQNDKMPACSSCHTDNPLAEGKHVITGKMLRPLAPQAEASRLSDPAKVEKWFRRNCQEVIGRSCSATEKADFVTFLSEVR